MTNDQYQASLANIEDSLGNTAATYSSCCVLYDAAIGLKFDPSVVREAGRVKSRAFDAMMADLVARRQLMNHFAANQQLQFELTLSNALDQVYLASEEMV